MPKVGLLHFRYPKSDKRLPFFMPRKLAKGDKEEEFEGEIMVDTRDLIMALDFISTFTVISWPSCSACRNHSAHGVIEHGHYKLYSPCHH